MATDCTESGVFIAHNTKGLLLLLDSRVASATPSKDSTVIFLVIIALTLIFEFLGLNEFLDLIHVCQAFRAEKFKLLDGLSQHALLQNTVHQIRVLLSCVKSGKNLHFVNNFSIFLRSFALKPLDLLQVK